MVTLPLLLLVLLSSSAQLSESCELVHDDDDANTRLHELLEDDDVKVVEYNIRVDGYHRDFWRAAGDNEWFQPWRWYRVKGKHILRLLLLFRYYYGVLKPYLGIGARDFELRLRDNATGCLKGLSSLDLESQMRQFLYYDLKNETGRQATKFTDDIQVCSQHVVDFSGWGRLVYRCCSRDDSGYEHCSDVHDDAWVWFLRAFIITLSVLLFLYFPMLIPKGYYVYSFHYYPPDSQSFHMLLTANPAKYGGESCRDSAVLPAARWSKLRKFAAEARKLQADVVYKVMIKRVTFECGMDRLLSETSSPVSVFRSVFDTWIRCKVRHADSLEDCCSAPVCGEVCCTSCPPWYAWLQALRTILLLLVLAIPAMPIMYVLSADNLEYQELGQMIHNRDLSQSYNFYLGDIFPKVVVAVLVGLYVLHILLVVVDGCHDQNLARAYTELLLVTRHKAKLRDRLHDFGGVIRFCFWPIKRFGVVAVPVGLVLLLLLPFLLLAWVLFTSPVPKLLVHAVKLLCGRTTGRRRKTKAEMSVLGLLENLLFMITLVDVFAVLTLALNFLVHVLVIGLVRLIVNVAILMKFFTIVVLLIVYIRDAFRVVNVTYATHHATVLEYVRCLEEEDVKEEAAKDWRDQENKIFKIVPMSAADSKGRAGEEEEEYKKKRLFMIKNDALRMRTRSLVLFLDKDDVPYIPKKFLEHTTTMECPGSPGRLEEAYCRAYRRFCYTMVFLMLIILPLLAFASTYEISTNLQFFAIIFTGTIPLVMRYFCISPGPVKKVDTCSLRFQTQMDDKVESFMQSWAVEDVIVERFKLPHEKDPQDLKNRPDKRKAPLPTEEAEESQMPDQAPAATPLKHPYQSESASVPPDAGVTKLGHLNYLLPDSSLDDGNDWLVSKSTDHDTSQQDDGTQELHRQPPHYAHKSPKKEKKKKKSKQSPLPLVDALQAREGNDYATPKCTHKERTALPGRKDSKKKRKKEVRIDLILDISDDKLMASSQLPEEEKANGVSKHPNIFWSRRARMVGMNRTDEHDV